MTDGLNPEMFERGPAAQPGEVVPKGRVSAPEYVDWHMILDHEIDALSRTEAGFIAAIGWAAFGAAIGNVPAALSAWDKLPSALNKSDLAALGIATVGAACAALCLGISRYLTYSAKKLPDVIRGRGKRPETV